jgi:hypothetical protein
MPARPLVLSIAQPFAYLVCIGEKLVENRSWHTAHRGRLWIHASGRLACDWSDIYNGEPAGPDEPIRVKSTHGGTIALPAINALPLGAIIGCVELVDCVPKKKLPKRLRLHPFTQGPVCWVCCNGNLLPEPVPCKGRLRLWTLPAGVRLPEA